MTKQYYILSLKWSKNRDKWYTFWRPNNRGYCWCLDIAGKYDEKTVMKKGNYYHSLSYGSLAIPCEEVDAVAKQVDAEGAVVSRSSKLMKALIAKHTPVEE